MSTGPTRGPVQRPDPDRDLTEIFQRVEDLERFPPGRWIYVGTYPFDAGTTPDSPPFENGWVNVGGGAQRLRFRRNSDWSLDIEGSVVGGVVGSAGSVVTTLNDLYRPSEDIEAPGVGGSWVLAEMGELIFFEGGDSDLTCDPCAEIAAHIADTEDAHMASAIGYLGSSDLPRDNAQDAIDYLLDLIDTGGGGVTSLSKSGSALLTGDVTLTGGSGVTLTQAGQDISIAASGSAGGSVKLYDFTITGSDQASIDSFVDGTTVTNFAGYDVLEIFVIARTDEAAAAVNYSMILNNDTSAIYALEFAQANASSTAASFSVTDTSWSSLLAHGSGGSSGQPGVTRITIPGYAATVFNKAAECTTGTTDATSSNEFVRTLALGYRSTSAITRVKVAAAGAAKFKVGTRLMVYGR